MLSEAEIKQMETATQGEMDNLVAMREQFAKDSDLYRAYTTVIYTVALRLDLLKEVLQGK